MTANFPATPSIGDTYSAGAYTYSWNGASWVPLPQRINQAVNSVTITPTSANVNLALGTYHKISDPNIDYTALQIAFNNIPAGSSRWFLEIDAPLGATGYDIANASLSTSYSVSTQAFTPYDVEFQPSGTTMFVLDDNSNRVHQYTLSTAWNVSTASYTSLAYFIDQDGTPISLAFRPDTGTSMYILGFSNRQIYQYTLLSAWSLGVGTVSYANKSFFISQDTSVQGMSFKPDGTKLYVTGASNDRIYQYSLSTPWDIATTTYDNVSFSVVGQDTGPIGVEFRPDGAKMFVFGFTNKRVFQYSLSTAWDVSTATYDNISFNVTQDTSPQKVTFRPDGTNLYMVGHTNKTVYQYATADTVSSMLWPTNVQWNNETPPRIYNGQNLLLEFYTTDGGNTIYGVERYNKAKT